MLEKLIDFSLIHHETLGRSGSNDFKLLSQNRAKSAFDRTRMTTERMCKTLNRAEAGAAQTSTKELLEHQLSPARSDRRFLSLNEPQ